jgi:hypothetical protein
LDPAVEEVASITGGSICSQSDYLFQLRDFESAFEEASLAQADEKTGDSNDKFLIPYLIPILIVITITMHMFDPILEDEYTLKIQLKKGLANFLTKKKSPQKSPSTRLKV